MSDIIVLKDTKVTVDKGLVGEKTYTFDIHVDVEGAPANWYRMLVRESRSPKVWLQGYMRTQWSKGSLQKVANAGKLAVRWSEIYSEAGFPDPDKRKDQAKAALEQLPVAEQIELLKAQLAKLQNN